MSRIGKLPITVPEHVEINFENSNIIVKGKFGILETNLPSTINISNQNGMLYVNVKDKTKTARSFHGLYRTLISNMVIGVSKQFVVNLILKGVGYRAVIQGNEMILNLGYSHLVKIVIPNEISAEVTQNTMINLKSCDKELLGLFAANIRAWRKPEPYKGKGILYKNEQIIRKAGKSAK